MDSEKKIEETKNDLDQTDAHAMEKDESPAATEEIKDVKKDKPAAKSKKKKEVSVKDLKKIVGELKEKREEARKAKDKQLITILKRKINRTRKKMRKLARA